VHEIECIAILKIKQVLYLIALSWTSAEQTQILASC